MTETQTIAPATAERFPWILAAFNLVSVIAYSLINPSSGVCGMIGCSVMLAVFTAALFVLRPRSKPLVLRRIAWQLIVLLPTFLIIAFGISSLPRFAIPRTLAAAQLAPLPPSAHALKSSHWSSGMAFEEFARFEADPQEIETFLSQSKGIADRKPTTYSSAYQRVLYDPKSKMPDRSKYDVVLRRPGVPAWWNEEIRGNGRVYQITSGWGGYVIYNEDEKAIYIRRGG